MVISKVDKKDKKMVVELTVGSDDFTSIFKEIKESLKQLKDSDPQDVLKLIDKDSYKLKKITVILLFVGKSTILILIKKIRFCLQSRIHL